MVGPDRRGGPPRLHVALVTEFYYPHLGGVTEHVHFLRRELVARGHEVTIVTSNMGPLPEPDPPYVVRVGTSRVLPSNGSFARITTGWGLRRRLAAIFRSRRVDLVHVHGGLAPTFGILAPRAAEDVGVPAVATFHSWFRRSVAYRVWQRPLRRECKRLAARIAVSEPVVHALSRYFETEFEIIPNGVDTNSFHPNGRRPVDALDGNPRLLFLGRLDPRNGLGTVLKAMPAILERYPGAELTVAGDGPLRSFYRQQAAPLGDRVRMMGRIYDERPHQYGTSDLYLCPTNKASFGITLLEAMACGTPLVASDIVGFRELVDGGEEAVLVPPDDPAAWSQAVIELLRDPEKRAAMGAAGLAKAGRYSWPEVSEQILSVYRRVLS